MTKAVWKQFQTSKIFIIRAYWLHIVIIVINLIKLSKQLRWTSQATPTNTATLWSMTKVFGIGCGKTTIQNGHFNIIIPRIHCQHGFWQPQQARMIIKIVIILSTIGIARFDCKIGCTEWNLMILIWIWSYRFLHSNDCHNIETG